MVVLPVLFLLASLFLCGRVEAQSSTTEMLKGAARKPRELTHFIPLNQLFSTQYMHIHFIFVVYIIQL